MNTIHLDPDGIHCEPIAIPPEEMNKRFVLLYTGAPRKSGINNWEVFKQHINGNKRVIRNFAEISRIAREMHIAMKSAKWGDVELLLNEEWKLRRSNASGITTPLIDKLIAAAKKQGARAAKVVAPAAEAVSSSSSKRMPASALREPSATMAASIGPLCLS